MFCPTATSVLYHYTRPIWARNTHQPAPEQLRNHPLAAAMS